MPPPSPELTHTLLLLPERSGLHPVPRVATRGAAEGWQRCHSHTRSRASGGFYSNAKSNFISPKQSRGQLWMSANQCFIASELEPYKNMSEHKKMYCEKVLQCEHLKDFTAFLVRNRCSSPLWQHHRSSWEVRDFRRTCELIFSCTCYAWRHASSSRSLLCCCFWAACLAGFWPTGFHL